MSSYIFEPCSTWKIKWVSQVCLWMGNRVIAATWQARNWQNGRYGWKHRIGTVRETPPPPPILHWRRTTKILFYFYGHYRGCGQTGDVEKFGDLGTWRYGLGISTRVGFKIRGGQQKYFHKHYVFVDSMANESLPWEAYLAFMYGRLIALGKQPGVPPVGVRETWRCPFVKCVLKVTGI